jgi:molecular chaperone DnaJ
MPKDYYETLGVERSASQDDIKRAYRRLSKELHPDKHKGDKNDKTAEHRYKEVNEAYEVLSNEKKRKSYDQFGHAGQNNAGFGGAQGFGGFNSADMGGFSDLFESFFGGGRSARGREQRGRDLEVAVEITFAEAVSGTEKTLRLRRQRTCTVCEGSGAKKGSKLINCKTCGGTGQTVHTVQSFFGTIQQAAVCTVCRGSGKVPEEPCPECKGEGRTEEKSDVKIAVPAGIHDGQTLRVRGEGEAGRQGTPAGDLFVQIHVAPDPELERDGDNIHSSISISVLDALLGAKAEVRGIAGPLTLKIPEGTQPGQVFRLQGKGMPVVGTSRHGDHFVTVQVDVPRKLNRKERELIEEWRNLKK